MKPKTAALLGVGFGLVLGVLAFFFSFSHHRTVPVFLVLVLLSSALTAGTFAIAARVEGIFLSVVNMIVGTLIVTLIPIIAADIISQTAG